MEHLDIDGLINSFINQQDLEVFEKECKNIFYDIVGNNIQVDSPIENYKKPVIYCDFTASGKPLKSIESIIENKISLTYANVHSTVGLNAQKTGCYFEQSKQILREYTNAFDYYSTIYSGQGATGGVHKLIEILSLKKLQSFYKYLEMAYNLKQKVEGIVDFYQIGECLLKEIEKQFKELFIDINFCHISKGRDNKYIECKLCNKGMSSEGDYINHLNEQMHKQNLEEYNTSGKKIYYDYIEEIKEKYYNKTNYLLELINDYQNFKPVVFYSVYEHNSNSLSWKEIGCDTVVIDPKEEKYFLRDLKNKLYEYKDRYIKIGSFTACSNITGLILDVDKIAYIIHSFKGYAIFDYAAGAPYLQINASGPLPDNYRKLLGFREFNQEEINSNLIYKDALFFSPHKFVGGPCTPGVLIVHDKIYRNQLKPTQPGGGTVHFVYKDNINYYIDVEFKEESGTPNIIGAIRLGLMLAKRSKIRHDILILKDLKYEQLFVRELDNVENLYILHKNYLKNFVHIPIYSFMISYDGKFLHPNFVSAVLNDFFGVQTRPGCSCAPNYGKFLLGFDKDKDKVDIMRKIINDGYEIFKPGYVRLNLCYFYPEYIIKYIIQSIKFVCQYGHYFLGLYEYDIKSGNFYLYKTKVQSQNLKNLIIIKENNLLYNNSVYLGNLNPEQECKNVINYVQNYLYQGNLLYETFFKGPYKKSQNMSTQIIIKQFVDIKKFENFRWFLLFQDVKDFLEALYFKKNNNNLAQYNAIDLNKKNNNKMNDWNIVF